MTWERRSGWGRVGGRGRGLPWLLQALCAEWWGQWPWLKQVKPLLLLLTEVFVVRLLLLLLLLLLLSPLSL